MIFRLAKYGLREVCLAAVAVTVVFALVVVAAALVSPWLLVAAAVPMAAWVWVLVFFRDPDRRSPQEEGLFLSPADGRVTDVTPLGPASALGREGVQVGIFMNLFDCHVNRSPCAGRVETIEHRPGAFLDARDPHAGERNEATTIRMRCTHAGAEFPVLVRQVAGLIARRIVTDLHEGHAVRAGQRIGMIKFGSRLELLVPRELAGEVRVRPGRRVRAGLTVLIATKTEASHEPETRH